eukprot:CAMPEP_0181455640 /NCGR_PEP_ID=MMETSP1110-20121109/30861_1 /TAXON_ID=174948 /ORGANISM="Symbiodinium sp., Strain CCMP421" /LENGTH=54 /DNA_ID=CAMNT_0023580029 /DNA_START=203 /DNA_END=363 /DNA_ORIENTATION=+
MRWPSPPESISHFPGGVRRGPWKIRPSIHIQKETHHVRLTAVQQNFKQHMPMPT